MDTKTMISRYIHPDGTVEIEIHCGCCGMFFMASVGGSAFCGGCVHGEHRGCKMNEIMGIE